MGVSDLSFSLGLFLFLWLLLATFLVVMQAVIYIESGGLTLSSQIAGIVVVFSLLLLMLLISPIYIIQIYFQACQTVY